MRRRAFNQGGIILRWSASKRFYAERPLAVQGGAPKSEAGLEDPEQLAQNGAVKNTDQGVHSMPEHENGVADTPRSLARRPLPLSPLMDPAYLAAKQKYRLPKAAPSKEPTPFQQQLAKNPYAQALATPVRMCSLTRTQLPSFFLQDFELIAHPSTNEPWYLPRSLTSSYSSSNVADESLPPDSPQSIGTRRGPRSYILSRSSLIRAIRTPRSGYTYGEERFPSQQTKQWKAFRALNTRWRRDMDTFVLDLMRQRIVEGLKYLCGRKRGYLTGCPDWEYAKGCRQVGAFLWLRPRDGETVLAVDEGMGQANGQEEEMAIGQEEKTAAVEVEGTLVAQEDEAAVGEGQQTMQGRSSTVAPGEFATLDMDRVKKSKVPVHNLQLLLGDTYIKDLRRHLPQIFDYEVVALKDRRATIDVQLRLWKLQGYLAEHKQLSDE